MTDIKKLLIQKENRKLEFKRELPTNEKLIKTAISFSNSQGGDLIIGVADDGSVLGVDEDDIVKFEEMISNTIYDSCVPNIMPEIYSTRFEEKILLVVHFYPSSQRPHYIKSLGKHKGTFVRVGSNNRLATLDILENLEREKRRISFDSVVNYDLIYSEDIFDTVIDKLETFFGSKPDINTFEKLRFVKKERDKYFFTNLGVWFSKKRDEFFPFIKIECARFKGTTTKVFLDQATYESNIVDSIESSIEFIKKNIRLGATIGEVYRKDKWEYPLLAIREIVINAVVHRDYSILGSDIKIALFDDMIEVTSSGYFMIEKEQLNSGCSELRNQNLGNLFKKIKIIEQWGTGFEKIRKELEVYPDVNLVIDDSSSLFVQIKLLKIVQKSTTPITTPITTKDKFLVLIENNPKIKRDNLAKELNISINTVKEYILKLKKDGVLERVGDNRNGYWEVNK
jgi:ATP-dependent DNA helicase RecG